MFNDDIHAGLLIFFLFYLYGTKISTQIYIKRQRQIAHRLCTQSEKNLLLVSILKRNLGGRVRKIKINYFKSKGNRTHLVDFTVMYSFQGKV
jgi:hypothetical protein